MPIYEYQCRHCGRQTEELQKLSDDALVTCTACGQDALVKLVSAAGFQLKGTGWYMTDYSKKGKSEGATQSEGAVSNAATSESHSAESANATDTKKTSESVSTVATS